MLWNYKCAAPPGSFFVLPETESSHIVWPDCPATHYIAQAILRPALNLLFHSPEYWDYRYELPHPAKEPKLFWKGKEGSSIISRSIISYINSNHVDTWFTDAHKCA